MIVIKHHKAEIFAYRHDPKPTSGVGIKGEHGAGPYHRLQGFSQTPGHHFSCTGTGNGWAQGHYTHMQSWSLSQCGVLVFPSWLPAYSFVLTWKESVAKEKWDAAPRV